MIEGAPNTVTTLTLAGLKEEAAGGESALLLAAATGALTIAPIHTRRDICLAR
jgi:hypothetical protein